MDCRALVVDSSTVLINLRYVESVDCGSDANFVEAI